MLKRSIRAAATAALIAGAAAAFAAQPAAKQKARPNPLLTPATLTAKAPEVFRARFDTTKGAFEIEVHREWAPNGADRFYNLVKNGFYDDCRFFRVIPDFMAQFGINGDPAVQRAWREASIQDDPVKQSNTRAMVSFAMRGPNSRTTQVFINYADRNAFLDSSHFAPFGKVVEGLDVVDKLNSEYGEGSPQGMGPSQSAIQEEGNAYLSRDFARLDYVKTARIVPPAK